MERIAHDKASGRRVTRTSSVPHDDRAMRQRIREAATEVRILDPHFAQALILERQRRGIDQYDEVWEGVYVVPPLANNPHQNIVGFLTSILFSAINQEEHGWAQPGANVSPRRDDWEHDYRCPDVVVVLKEGRAVDCGTHWMGGPDFLVEVQSPRDDTDEKIPFYSRLQVRELLIIHRDTRALYRHDGGQELVPVESTEFRGGKWLVSEVVPFAFRRKGTKKEPRTEICRTDAASGSWTV